MENNFLAKKRRRKTREIKVGGVSIGSKNPIRVQTMTTTDTLNIDATLQQIISCFKAGAELVRVTTQTPKHAQALGEIKNKLIALGFNIPLIADVHFSPAAAFEALKFADKIRINPGNFLEPAKQFKERKYTKKAYELELKELERAILPFIEELKKYQKPIRIGANHGSLSDRIMARYGDTAQGMVESVLEYIRIFKKHNYENLIIGIKSSDPLTMIEANRLLVHEMDKMKIDYPLHLGVTEAGSDEDGRAKSILGIGTLLLEGIGDTIRVSLTEAPEKEIPVCYSILQASRSRITKTEFISCPSCGRTLFDLESVTKKIKLATGHLKGVRIAIMGCIVNGLGEMADAHFGYVGGKPGKINLYVGKKLVKKDIPEKKALDELIELIKKEGKWREI